MFVVSHQMSPDIKEQRPPGQQDQRYPAPGARTWTHAAVKLQSQPMEGGHAESAD